MQAACTAGAIIALVHIGRQLHSQWAAQLTATAITKLSQVPTGNSGQLVAIETGAHSIKSEIKATECFTGRQAKSNHLVKYKPKACVQMALNLNSGTPTMTTLTVTMCVNTVCKTQLQLASQSSLKQKRQRGK